MQPQLLASLGGLFAIAYLICVVGIVIYVLMLLGRFVSAHERTASALEIISRKLRDDSKP
jgi:hypothetical protein